MKFSFITPIYNTNVKLLQKNLESIENLDLSDYEVVWVNDGSSNVETNKFCEQVSSENKHVKYHVQDNKGSAVARNVALDKARGDYLIFVDADDTINEEFDLKNFDCSADIVIYGYQVVSNIQSTKVVVDQDGEDLIKLKKEILQNILYNPNVLQPYAFGAVWAKCFSKRFVDREGLRFHDELRKTQDRVFMLEAISVAKSISKSDDVMYDYYLNSESITHKVNYKVIDYYRDLIKVIRGCLQKYNIPLEYGMYLEYSLFIETLNLTYFNVGCDLPPRERRKKFLDLYSVYDFKSLKVRDFKTIKQKIQFILIKERQYKLLGYYYSKR